MTSEQRFLNRAYPLAQWISPVNRADQGDTTGLSITRMVRRKIPSWMQSHPPEDLADGMQSFRRAIIGISHEAYYFTKRPGMVSLILF